MFGEGLEDHEKKGSNLVGWFSISQITGKSFEYPPSPWGNHLNIRPDLALGLKVNKTCNQMSYPPMGIQADQLPESFADWFSAEMAATILKIKMVDLRRDLCEKKELTPGSSYPSNEARLNRIYFVNPKLKLPISGMKPLEKTKEIKYCDWRS